MDGNTRGIYGKERRVNYVICEWTFVRRAHKDAPRRSKLAPVCSKRRTNFGKGSLKMTPREMNENIKLELLTQMIKRQLNVLI